MSNILITTYWFKKAGTEVATFSMIRELINHGHKVDLLYFKETGPLFNEVPKSVNLIKLTFDNDVAYTILGKNDCSCKIKKYCLKIICKGLKKLLPEDENHTSLYRYLLKHADMSNLQKKYDYIFDFYGYGNFFTALCAKKMNAKKKALWFHDENVNLFYKAKPYIKYYDACFCVSDAVKESLIDKYPEYKDKFKTLHNFIDSQEIIKKSNELLKINDYAADFKILTIGRITPQKGIDRAIYCAYKLKQKGYQFIWYIIGNGAQRDEYEKEVNKLNIQDVFKFLGIKNNPYPYLKKCDLYVQPSRHEGYSVAIVEAKALECSIIASNIPSNQEQINNGYNGYLVSNETELVEKIEYLYNHKEARMNLKKTLKNENIDFTKDYKIIEAFMS